MIALLGGGFVAQASESEPCKGTMLSPVKSPNDTRSYGLFTLPNRMKVLLISDPNATVAAAALSVRTGSTSEPKQFPGLAHFLEHMLFLGTRRYPKVSSYQQFIAEHGGEYNAATGANTTHYGFTVAPDALEEALDRFSDFFIAPLFDANFTNREKHAVESEYRLKLKQEPRRLNAALKQAYNPQSPYARFSAGNLETLADKPGATVRDALLRFYKRHYSANLMSLVVQGPQSLSALRQMVCRHFSAVPDRNASAYLPGPGQAALPLSRLPAALGVRSQGYGRTLGIVFPIPSPLRDYRVAPVKYLSNLLSAGTRGSFYNRARAKGWIEGMSVSGESLDPTQGEIEVSLTLTPKGERQMKELLGLFFSYVDLIRQKGLEPWRYQEREALDKLLFRYASKENPFDYATNLADRLHDYPPEEVIVGGNLLQRYDPKILRYYLDYLRPDNALYLLSSPDSPVEKRERYYGVEYAYKKVDPAELNATIRRIASEANLSLPAPNPYIPKKLDLKQPEKTGRLPRALLKEPGFSLWHATDTSFGVPRASVQLLLRSATASRSPKEAVAQDLWVLLIDADLERMKQQAYRAGLGYGLQSKREGVLLSIYGYDEKIPLLLQRVMERMARLPVDARRFALGKGQLGQQLENEGRDLPFRQVLKAVMRSLSPDSWSAKEKLQALQSLTLADLEAYKKRFFSELEATMLSVGNLTPEESRALAQKVRRLLPARWTPVPEAKISLPKPGQPRLLEIPVAHPDAVVVAADLSAGTDPAAWARWQLLAQIYAQPFYTELRTRQQLGYVVTAAAFSQLRHPGMLRVVESSSSPAGKLRKRIEAFAQAFARGLDSLDGPSFERVRQGLLRQLEKPDATLADRADRYLANLLNHSYGFDFNARIAREVRLLSPKDLVDFYRKALLKEPLRILGISEGKYAGAKKESSKGDKR